MARSSRATSSPPAWVHRHHRHGRAGEPPTHGHRPDPRSVARRLDGPVEHQRGAGAELSRHEGRIDHAARVPVSLRGRPDGPGIGSPWRMSWSNWLPKRPRGRQEKTASRSRRSVNPSGRPAQRTAPTRAVESLTTPQSPTQRASAASPASTSSVAPYQHRDGANSGATDRQVARRSASPSGASPLRWGWTQGPASPSESRTSHRSARSAAPAPGPQNCER